MRRVHIVMQILIDVVYIEWGQVAVEVVLAFVCLGRELLGSRCGNKERAEAHKEIDGQIGGEAQHCAHSVRVRIERCQEEQAQDGRVDWVVDEKEHGDHGVFDKVERYGDQDADHAEKRKCTRSDELLLDDRGSERGDNFTHDTLGEERHALRVLDHGGEHDAREQNAAQGRSRVVQDEVEPVGADLVLVDHLARVHGIAAVEVNVDEYAARDQEQQVDQDHARDVRDEEKARLERTVLDRSVANKVGQEHAVLRGPRLKKIRKCVKKV